MDYIKVFFKDHLYGPIRAPTSLAILCNALKISPRAIPILERITSDKQVAQGSAAVEQIRDIDAVVCGGLYSLCLSHDLAYDETLDGPYILRKDLTIRSDLLTKVSEGSRGGNPISPPNSVTNVNGSIMPLSRDEMEECLAAMIHLIRSIPDRWVKYNKVLSLQITNALAEVDQLKSALASYDDHVAALDQSITTAVPCSAPRNGKTETLPRAILITYTQYRIIHILYETWKTVWRRFSPRIRTIQVSKVETVNAFDIAEGYLNRIWSWRRMMDRDTWEKLEQKRQSDEKSRLKTGKYATDMPGKTKETARLLKPRPLSSGNHPHVWEYLAQPNSLASQGIFPSEKRFAQLDPVPILKDLRSIFIETMIQNGIYQDQDLELLLNELVQLDKTSRLAANGYSEASKKQTSSQDDYDLIYPVHHVLKTLRKEFRINVSPDSEAISKAKLSSFSSASQKTQDSLKQLVEALHPV